MLFYCMKYTKTLISSDIEDNQQKKRYQPYLF